MKISVIVPALNEEQTIGALLGRLPGIEVIVVDGGSTDRTVEVAGAHGALVCRSMRGRGAQMDAGARVASGHVLWFLHADSLPTPQAIEEIQHALADPDVAGGYFRLCFHGNSRGASFLNGLYPKLRYLGLVYGDSGFFVRREAYEAVGGFRPYPLFEDVDFYRRMRALGGLRRIDCVLVTSARRWEGRSFEATFARWTLFQLLYWCGVSPEVLGRRYSPIRGEPKSARTASV